MVIVDENSLPVALLISSASPHEITLLKDTIDSRFLRHRIRRITGDNAYDSDGKDEELQRKGRKAAPTQDARKLKGYKRRWKVERYFAWLFNFRKCVVRYEHKDENFFGFLLLASAFMMIR